MNIYIIVMKWRENAIYVHFSHYCTLSSSPHSYSLTDSVNQALFVIPVALYLQNRIFPLIPQINKMMFYLSDGVKEQIILFTFSINKLLSDWRQIFILVDCSVFISSIVNCFLKNNNWSYNNSMDNSNSNYRKITQERYRTLLSNSFYFL